MGLLSIVFINLYLDEMDRMVSVVLPRDWKDFRYQTQVIIVISLSNQSKREQSPFQMIKSKKLRKVKKSGMLKAITNELSLKVLVKPISRGKESHIRVSNQSFILGISDEGQILWMTGEEDLFFFCPLSFLFIHTN